MSPIESASRVARRALLLLATLVLVSSCAQNAPQTYNEPLENTYWKLTQLGETPVRAEARQREAHFILHPADRRVIGSGGCNRLTGTYALAGDQLSFGSMASTRMACLGGMETESKFLAVLQKPHQARVAGQQLELLDASGAVVARFEAVHF